MRLLQSISIFVIILIYSHSSIANKLPRNLQGVYLGSEVSNIPVLLNCDENFFEEQKKIIANINEINIYMCLKNFSEALLFLTKSKSDNIIGIIQYPNIFINIFTKLDNKQEAMRLKNKIQDKYGKGKSKLFVDIKNTVVWENETTILIVNDFGVMALFERKYSEFLNKNFNFDELHKYMFGNQFKDLDKKQNKAVTNKEIKIIQNHIKKCWKMPEYIRYNRHKILLKIKLSKNMTVSSAQIVEIQKYSKNKSYRAAADIARMAVLECSPIPIDKSYYESLKQFEMEFDTNQMN